MAFRPMARPDRQQKTQPRDASNASPSELHGGDLALPPNSERPSIAADLGPDLVLELALNEVVEQTLLATNASGAAIALIRGDEMVCRATAGANAPDLGVRLNTDAGISGICVRTQETQHCEDTEVDPRVDRWVCRQLGVRSILIVPVLGGDRLLGVFEIFSAVPGAFSDRDAATLEALSRKVIEVIRRTEVEPTSAPSRQPPRGAPSDAPWESPQEAPVGFSPAQAPRAAEEVPAAESLASKTSFEASTGVARLAKARPRDRWTQALTAGVVVVALLLGWVLGRVEWFKATHGKMPHPALSAMQSSTSPSVARADTRPPSAGGAPETPSQPSGAGRADEDPGVRGGGTDAPDMSSNQGDDAGSNQLPVSNSSRPELRAEILRSRRGLITSELADSYLLKRVDPEYPEVARRQNVQGSVLLHVKVKADGTLEEVNVVSGPALLAAAAADAVWQWRFRPLTRQGSPAGFETRVKVDFRLP